MRETGGLTVALPDWPEDGPLSRAAFCAAAEQGGYGERIALRFGDDPEGPGAADVVLLRDPASLPDIALRLNGERQLLAYLADGCRALACPEAERGETARLEWELCHAARLILVPESGVREKFCRCYSLEAEKLRLLPVGPGGEETRAGDMLAMLAQQFRERLEHDRPYFSVVVPSYERPALLERLLDSLTTQSWGDFEVIVVDQSAEPWQGWRDYPMLDLTYRHGDSPGAVRARNTGIRLARGHVVAFTDDDCIPEPDWLLLAKPYFDREQVVGLEGSVKADIYESSKYRVVTNRGIEGVGFMTANLFARREVLLSLGGFDENFDDPHFREDTELGWRLLDRGEVPFSRDAAVLHPSVPRRERRDSLEERNRFFVHDALLLQRDRERFLQLFLAERHYRERAYWDYFRRGMDRHGLPMAEIAELVDCSGIREEYIPEWLLPGVRERREAAE